MAKSNDWLDKAAGFVESIQSVGVGKEATALGNQAVGNVLAGNLQEAAEQYTKAIAKNETLSAVHKAVGGPKAEALQDEAYIALGQGRIGDAFKTNMQAGIETVKYNADRAADVLTSSPAALAVTGVYNYITGGGDTKGPDGSAAGGTPATPTTTTKKGL